MRATYPSHSASLSTKLAERSKFVLHANVSTYYILPAGCRCTSPTRPHTPAETKDRAYAYILYNLHMHAFMAYTPHAIHFTTNCSARAQPFAHTNTHKRTHTRTGIIKTNYY